LTSPDEEVSAEFLEEIKAEMVTISKGEEK
jgi:hypothetical protein